MQQPKRDLYAVLGVDKAADKKSIKAAYRKEAKKSHPDMPTGDPGRFALVKKAHDILLDAERRAKYDATGDDSEKAPDNAYSQAVNVIAMAFAMVLGECAQSGQSPLERDVCMAVRQKINANIGELQKQIRVHRNMLETDRKLAGRFKSKKKAQRNIFEDIVAQRITGMEMNIANLERNVKGSQEALKMIEGFTFRSDAPEFRPGGNIGKSYFTILG